MSANSTVFDAGRHEFIEAAMTRLQIEWTVIVVKVDSVDLKDNSYQTRLNVAESSAVVSREYAEKIRGGEVFPMVVLEEKSPGRYRIVCGRHRATAYTLAQNGKTAYRAYLVAGGTDKSALVALSARENNGNGVRQGSADTAKVAADELARMPIATNGRRHRAEVIKEVAARFSANVSTVTDHYHLKLVSAEMIRVNVQPTNLAVSAARKLWRWTDSAEWAAIARAVIDNASLPGLGKIISEAHRDRVDGRTLVKRIEESVDSHTSPRRGGVPAKDPATVTIEHLSLALQDIRVLPPIRNLSEEIAEEISDVFEAVRLSVKEWKQK